MRGIGVILITVLATVYILGACVKPTVAPAPEPTPAPSQAPAEESVELQARGNGTVELVMEPVYDGTYSAKLKIPEHYSWGDAARIAMPLDSVTLNDISSLSFWLYVDPDTPVNRNGMYWAPYITFEVDTDGQPDCDTWVLGGIGDDAAYSSAEWLKVSMSTDERFHVATDVSGYTSPFPLDSMGTLEDIKTAMGPDDKTSLGDCIVSKVRIAIGNWGEGGPRGPVIYYVDELILNGRPLF